MEDTDTGVQRPGTRRGAGSETPPVTRPGRWFRKHTLLIESVLVAAMFLYDMLYLPSVFLVQERLTRLGFITAVLLSLGVCILFVFRRRSPLPIAATIFLASWGYVALGIGYSVAPLIVLALILYFLGTQFDWTIVLPATVAVGSWMVIAGLPLIEEGYLRIGHAGMLILLDVLAAVLGLMTQIRRRHIEGLQELNIQLARERDARAQIAAAEERTRIAREIHDIVAHSLGTMVVVADGASRTAEVEPRRASAMMAQVRDTGRNAMTDMRRMLDVLRDGEATSRSPQPGLGQLEQLVGDLRSTGIRVDMSITGEAVDLPSGVDLAAYRIVQEAFSNARKHGGPMLSHVRVSVTYGDNSVDVRVVDDGQGPLTSFESGGHGLIGMRERVTAYGGSLEFESPESGGFVVHANLPIGGES